MRLYNVFRHIGLSHLKARPSRAVLTTLGVAFGISLYVAISIINHSTRNSMRDSIDAVAGKSKLSISAGVAGFPEEKLETIRVIPGVRSAVPMIEARAFFEGATESADGLQIMGVDLLQEASVRTYKATDQRIIDDPLTFLNQADSIILTRALAAKRGLKIEDRIRLSTASGAREFTIRGLLEPEGAARAYGGSLAIMDIDGARVSFGKENKLDRVDIVPASDEDIETLKKRIESTLGAGYRVERPETQSEQMERMLASYQLILTFFSSLALLVGLFLVMNSISIAVAERKREIGTLRALGATRMLMVGLFVSEILGVGFIGSALGCVLGKGLAHRMASQITTSVAAQFQTRIEVARLEFTTSEILFTLTAGTLASILAALIPALRAADIHPLESMKRHAESTDSRDDRRSKLQILAGFLLLVFMTFSMVGSWGRFSVLIDLATKGSAVLGAALFGPFLVFGLMRMTRNTGKVLSLPVLAIAQENLLRSRKRTGANVMALMVGLFLVMLIASVRSSFHDTLTDWLDRIFVADLMVGSNGRFISGDVQAIRDEIGEELLKIPGIRAIGPERGAATRIIPYYYEGKKMAIKAIDRYADFYGFRNLPITGSDRVETARALYESPVPAALVSRGFLKNAGKSIGQSFELDSPSGKVAFKIVGEITDYASSQGVIYLDRKVYKRIWNDPLVTVFVFNLEPGHRFEEVRSAIAAGIGRKWNLVTISNREFKDQMQSAIERSFAYTRVIESIALLVGLLGLLNTLLISVMERTREIGVLRAVGATRAQISRMILTEAVIQGFFGALVAILLGAYVGRLFVEYALTEQLGWIIEYHFPKASVFTTVITGIVVAGIAGLWPSRKASRLQITEALDYE
jgi:putative ABC transport system permease protein